MKDISVKGITLGILAMFMIDTLFGIAIIPLFASNMSTGSIDALYQDTGPLMYSFFTGTFSTIIGGLVAANIGHLAVYKNASVIGVLGVVIGAVMSEGFPIWFNVLSLCSVIPAALLGGYIAARKHAS